MRHGNLEKALVTNVIKVLNFALRYMFNISVGLSTALLSTYGTTSVCSKMKKFSQSEMFPVQQLPNFGRYSLN